MLTIPKCHDCGKFCRPVEWQMIYSGALPEPQEEIYKCASCAEKNGSFVPQSGIKPEHSCGGLTHNVPSDRLAEDKKIMKEIEVGVGEAGHEGSIRQSASTGGLGSGVGFATAFFAELSAAQQPLSPDFAKVLYDNLWQLYEK